MSSNFFNVSRFYPGNIWFKRLGYLLLVYSIGLNFFFGTIQNKIIKTIEEKTNEIESSNLLLKENKFPNLDYIQIERDSKLEYAFELFRHAASRLKYDVITVDRVNEIAAISNNIDRESQKITVYIGSIKELLNVILKVIKITSNLVWISIIWALIWLYFDVRKGNARRFVKAGVLCSVPFNIAIFYMLSNQLINGLVSFGY